MGALDSTVNNPALIATTFLYHFVCRNMKKGRFARLKFSFCVRRMLGSKNMQSVSSRTSLKELSIMDCYIRVTF